METIYKNQTYTLSKKMRKVGAEAPAVRTKMLDNQIQVIGMMGAKIQVMITLIEASCFSQALNDVLMNYASKISAYIITSDTQKEIQSLAKTYDFDEACISVEFEDFANKFGVNMENQHIANALFIIDKEGEFTYIDILKDDQTPFDVKAFENALDELVNTKVKGHTHENWMGA